MRTEENQFEPRWRVQVEGGRPDLLDLQRLLNGSATCRDSLVVWLAADEPEVFTLASHAWDRLDRDVDVQQAAESALRLVSGALRLHTSGEPLTLGTIYERQEGGRFTISRLTTLRIFVRPEESMTIAEFGTAVAVADDQEWLTSALIELSGQEDWYSVYRIIESIMAALGGEAAMFASELVDGTQLKRIKQMANSVRHVGYGKHRPPDPPVDLGAAYADTRKALRALIVDAEKRRVGQARAKT